MPESNTAVLSKPDIVVANRIDRGPAGYPPPEPPPKPEVLPSKVPVIDLGAYYQNRIDQFKADQIKNSIDFSVLKNRVEERDKANSRPDEEKPARVFSWQDKLRHKTLLAEARLRGVKDLEGFQKLVEYFETSIDNTEHISKSFKKKPNEKDIDSLSEKWKKMGFYRVSSFGLHEQQNGSFYIQSNKDIPFNLDRRYIPALKELLSLNPDPISVIQTMRDAGMYYWDSSIFPEDELKRLLKAPQSKQALDIVKSIPNWDRNWVSYSHNHSTGEKNPSSIDVINALAESDNPQEKFSPDLVDKIAVLSKAMGRKVSPFELESYKELINNPEQCSFLVALLLHRNYDLSTVSIFEDINALSKANLLKPLTTLISSGVNTDYMQMFEDESYRSNKKTQAEIIKELQEAISQTQIQELLLDPEKQNFVGLVAELTGERIAPANIQEALGYLNRKEELVYLFDLIYGDPKNKERYQQEYRYRETLPIGVINSILRDTNKELAQTFSSSEFISFLNELKAQGFEALDSDFFQSRYKSGENPTRLYPGSPLKDVFEAKDFINAIGIDSNLGVMENLRESAGLFDGSVLANYWRLQYEPNWIDTFNLLKAYGLLPKINTFDRKEMQNLINIGNMPLIQKEVIDKIPDSSLQQWLENIITIPNSIQQIIQGRLQIAGGEVDDDLMQRINKLSRVFKQVDTRITNVFAGEKIKIAILNDEIDWDKISSEDVKFWKYFDKFLSSQIFIFLLKNIEQFSEMVENDQETPLFYQLLVTQEPDEMLHLANIKPGLSARQYQDIWRLAIGKEVMDGFLASLPKATDEARNAFTGNEYDRTSQFLRYLKDRIPQDQFGLNFSEFPIMTDYIKQFGLARNETIYKYYRQLHMFEHGKIPDLPEDMKALGVTSTAEMIKKVVEVRKMVFGETQLRDIAELKGLTPFQIQLLANVTRYDSARFGASNADVLSRKIGQFTNDLEHGLITPIPEGYKADTIKTSSIKVEFNAELIKEDYEALRTEILECIDNPPTVELLKGEVKAVIERKVKKINDALGRVTNEKAKEAMTRDLSTAQGYISQLEGVKDIDSLTLSLLGMNFSNEDRSGSAELRGIDSIVRRVILSKLYQRVNRSPGFIENTRIKLSKDEITAEGIDEIVLTVDEMVKNHVLSLDFKNKEGYWDPEVFKTILGNDALRKNFRRITERFNPHTEKLRQEQARFIKTQTGKVSDVQIIPDRGFIGEMGGYLADVCYVRVSDLLKSYSGQSPEKPLVVPYKFVTFDSESNEPRFLGSVLVFEVQTAKGEPSLLVRALDIPNESEVDIGKFTESLLDKFADVAKKRGKKKVLVSGTPGTISNYGATTNHVLGEYVRGKEPEPVSPNFNFNEYDITNAIYIARTVS